MATESLWLPRSSCGPRCLPPPGTVPAVGQWRVAGRLLALLVVLALALLAAPVLLLSGPRTPHRVSRPVARAVLRALGVRHRLRGARPRGPALVVVNHVSWLDPLVLLAYLPVRLVAKREVRGWPVVGLLARAAGTLFVDRSRPLALPATVARVAAALRGGSVVALFPEGTTWCGNEGGRFRPAMFQAAIDARAVVLPATLRFRLGDGAATTVAAYLGDDSLAASVRRVVTGQGIHVDVDLHAALHPVDGATRQALARTTESSITRDIPMTGATAGGATAPTAKTSRPPPGNGR